MNPKSPVLHGMLVAAVPHTTGVRIEIGEHGTAAVSLDFTVDRAGLSAITAALNDAVQQGAQKLVVDPVAPVQAAVFPSVETGRRVATEPRRSGIQAACAHFRRGVIADRRTQRELSPPPAPPTYPQHRERRLGQRRDPGSSYTRRAAVNNDGSGGRRAVQTWLGRRTSYGRRSTDPRG